MNGVCHWSRLRKWIGANELYAPRACDQAKRLAKPRAQRALVRFSGIVHEEKFFAAVHPQEMHQSSTGFPHGWKRRARTRRENERNGRNGARGAEWLTASKTATTLEGVHEQSI